MRRLARILQNELAKAANRGQLINKKKPRRKSPLLPEMLTKDQVGDTVYLPHTPTLPVSS